MGEVQTVLGKVSSDSLGVVLPHEHIYIDLEREYRGAAVLHDPELMTSEVNRYAEAGGGTIVECTTPDIGRRPAALRKLAEATGLNIVMAAGHYRQPYLDSEWFDRHYVDELAEFIVHDIVDGVDDGEGPPIQAGVIGEVGTEFKRITAAEERAFRACARAHNQTGVVITTHAARWPVGLDQLELLMSEGVDPRRIIIGHCDTVPDASYHEAIAKTGAFTQFDTLALDVSDYQIGSTIRYIKRLVDLGYERQILVSQDVAFRRCLVALGGVGYDYLLREFEPRLRKAGLSEEIIQLVLVENPARAFAIS